MQILSSKAMTRSLIPLLLIAMLFLSWWFWLRARDYATSGLHRNIPVSYWTLSDGNHIAYHVIPAKGKEAPCPIFFIQGGPGAPFTDLTVRQFSSLADEGYRVYLFDETGCGQSGRLKDIKGYTAERHVRDLDEIIQQTGFRQVILIGQSWGAILATLYLADHLEKVNKIILTGPGPIVPVNPALESLSPPDSLHFRKPLWNNAIANRLATNPRTNMVRFMATHFGLKMASDQEMDEFQDFLSEKLNRSIVCDTSMAPKVTKGGGYYDQIMTVNSFSRTADPRSKLKDCSVPVLIMKGECDNQKWGYLQEYLYIFKEAKFVLIPGAGHNIFIEQPERYQSEILGFLNSNK